MEERYLSLSEAADALDISERTAYRWIKSGKLRAYKPGRDYRIPETAIKEAVEESEVRPKAESRWSPEPSFNDVLDEERRSSKTVTGGAHLSGTGKLTAAGEVVARIMQIMDKRREEKISDEEVVEQVRELVVA